MTVYLKRIYEEPVTEDGLRILVDRLWPRGVSKGAAHIDLWLKDLAPSEELRRWFNHDPYKWEQFKAAYFQELDQRPEGLSILENCLQRGDVTLVYAAKEARFNNAAALKEYLKTQMGETQTNPSP